MENLRGVGSHACATDADKRDMSQGQRRATSAGESVVASGRRRRKRKAKPHLHHVVYVVFLRNPQGDGKAGYYVGMTGLTPEKRFENHKAKLPPSSPETPTMRTPEALSNTERPLGCFRPCTETRQHLGMTFQPPTGCR